MDIGIIGAGIAGLSAAIALRRIGHNVTIFEKSCFKNEIGAAITLTPNANRILERWNFDFEKARPVDFMQYRYLHSETLEVCGREDLSGVQERYGSRMCAYHRVDLHEGLRVLAEGEWGVGIRLGCAAVGVDADKGEVEFINGEKVKKDMWIMADGCHTPFLPQILKESIPTTHIGKSVYRWLSPLSLIRTNPQCAQIWDPSLPSGFVTFFNPRTAIMMVTYPCRNSTLLNCALFHTTRPEESNAEGWHSNSTHDHVLRELDGASAAVKHLVLQAEQIKVYKVTQRRPSTKCYGGNVLCIGDTVHYMLPSHAQGGAMAVEDAGALEILFDPKTYTHSPAALSKRLSTFEKLRLPRTATTQIMSSLNPNLTMEGLERQVGDIRRFYAGELVDWPRGCGPWSEAIREFW
ncbi:FAD/NAD(P)-binding domain-containing protein, partial [Amniculicola lignicola CBS 123094]